MHCHKVSVTFENKIIHVEGDLVFSTVMSVLKSTKPYLLKQAGEVQVDFKNVIHSDSSALALLCEWLRIGRPKRLHYSFLNIPQQLLSIAAISGVKEILGLA